MRPGFIFKRESAAAQRRLFAGPLLPPWLTQPGLIPAVPDLPGCASKRCTQPTPAKRTAGAHPERPRRLQHPPTRAAGFRSLEEGQRVEFEVGQGAKGPQATGVRIA